MQRQALMMLAVVFGALPALAQDGELRGVTMRVLDDVGDAETIVLQLDANRSDSEEGAEHDDAAAPAGERSRPDATRDDAAEQDRRELRSERDELHDADEDERSEGRLEDRDIERPAATPTPTP